MNNYVFVILCLLIYSCKKEKEETIIHEVSADYTSVKLSSNRPNLNISILLDLSDRINPEKYPNPAMDFYLRDIGYIKSIAESFELHLRNKKSIKIHDNIQLFLDPEPADKNLNNKINHLKMSFTRDNATKAMILKISKSYDSISKSIYESAINDAAYVGSDTWRFVKTKAKDYCIEKNHRNILVILTDGYIYHKNNIIKEGNLTTYIRPQDIRNFKLNTAKWENKIMEHGFGFIPATDSLQDLEVLVLGINPDIKNPYEEDVIIKYWSDWFDKMNVGYYEIKTASLPSNMDKIIKDFILKE
ncbi:hypothetical protein Q4Q34_04505 [Flavivirga abyssicola]|uniref:hypothetical protein n=1 Tax=Flavivirga abyssicola TaxID=3063533 RepID=UPI0026DEA7BB|nr:hypothetical protein [Flavivirga sp. MEBiC07777]WVK14289.1 hypothetical protein Q4Q34_04505 [Flavivirga sp. MEBiC07777]